MSLHLPFVSRGRYEEMKSALERQMESSCAAKDALISELQGMLRGAIDERQKLIDHFHLLSFGRPVFSAPPDSPDSAKPDVTDLFSISDSELLAMERKERDGVLMKRAAKLGYRSARAVAHYIDTENQRLYAAAQRESLMAEVERDFAAAEQEGQRAAQEAKTA